MSLQEKKLLVSFIPEIADELSISFEQIENTLKLLIDDCTIPFIARYRKEVTGGLDDTQLRHIEERLLYLRELEDRRVAILKSIHEQGKLTDALTTSIHAAVTKQALEDLYLPYKPRRRTKAMIAREAGLEPLARALMENPKLAPQEEAMKYINIDAAAYAALTPEQIKKSQAGEEGAKPFVPDIKAALDGARDILAEEFSELAPLLAKLREHLWTQGIVSSKVVTGQEMAEEEKFRKPTGMNRKAAREAMERLFALIMYLSFNDKIAPSLNGSILNVQQINYYQYLCQPKDSNRIIYKVWSGR